MTPTDTCRQCDKTDTLRYRLTECGEGPLMWNWTQRLARLLNTDRRRIPEDWLLRPTLNLRPTKLQRAVLWILANFIMYRLQQRRTPSLQD